MITAQELAKILAAYDEKTQDAKPLGSEDDSRKLVTLRTLARGASPDLSGPLSNMFRSYTAPSSDWSTWTSFEKMVAIIGKKSGLPQYESITEAQCAEFLSETLAVKIATDETVPTEPTEADIRSWLAKLMCSITESLGGTVYMGVETIDGKRHICLNVEGPIETKYSVFMTLRHIESIPEGSILRAEDIDNNLDLTLDTQALINAFLNTHNLDYFQKFLTELGFIVEIGSRRCREAFSTHPDFLSKNDASLQTKLNVQLAVATHISQSSSQIILPLTLKILTRDDRLMQQLESYYAHPMANLRGANGLLKTFIAETRASGLMHESNLNLPQMLKLRDFFERLAFFAKYLGRSPIDITEAELTLMTNQLLESMLDNKIMHRMVESWNKPSDFLVRPKTQTSVSGTTAALDSSCFSAASNTKRKMTTGIDVSTFVRRMEAYLNVTLFSAASNTKQKMTTGIDAPTFERSMEAYLNDELIPGPDFFLGNNPLFSDFSAIYASAEDPVAALMRAIDGSSVSDSRKESSQALVTYKEDEYVYGTIPDCYVPKSPIPMVMYARAIANNCLERRSCALSDNFAQHRDGVAWLNKIVDRSTYGSAAAQPYLDFYTQNSAYYILDNAISHLKTFLDDYRCTEAHVSRILNILGVSPTEQAFYQMSAADHRFNRFQIKFFLFPLVLNTLLEKNILLPVKQLADMRHPWVAQVVVRGESKDTPLYVRTVADWQKLMTEWKNNEIQDISWSVGGPDATTERKYYSTRGAGSTTFGAGGSGASTKKVEEAAEEATNTRGG